MTEFSKPLFESPSIVDMIRKLCYMYEQPIDWLDSFTSELYRPGAKVIVKLNRSRIILKSDSTLDDHFFERAQAGAIDLVAKILPPTVEYAAFSLRSRDRILVVNHDRQISTGDGLGHCNGTALVIKRKSKADLNEETGRLLRLYDGTDLKFVLGRMRLRSRDHPFEKDGFKGTLRYLPLSKGGLHVFSKGRKILTDPSVKGVDIYVHNHGMATNLTKSSIVRSGESKKEYERLLGLVPTLVAEYLLSDSAQRMKENTPLFYQALLRMAFVQYGENASIRDTVTKEIRFPRSGVYDDRLTMQSEETPAAIGNNGVEWNLYRQLSGKPRPQVVFSEQKVHRTGTERALALRDYYGLNVKCAEGPPRYDTTTETYLINHGSSSASLEETALTMVRTLAPDGQRAKDYKKILEKAKKVN